MKAESRALSRIFEQTIRYQVPLFQRPYVWKQEENWEPLWQDIRYLLGRWCMNRPRRKRSIIRALRSAREELSACPL